MTIRNDFIVGIAIFGSVIASFILFSILYWCIIFGGGITISLIIGTGNWIVPYAWLIFILTVFGCIAFIGNMTKFIMKDLVKEGDK